MAPKVKTCKEQTRNSVTGIGEPCNTEHPEGSECPRRRTEHMLPFQTGWCHSGFHEGLKPRSFSGQPCPTCKFWLTCPCDCHDLVSMMFQANNLPRVAMENPEYIPYHMPSMMTLEERAATIAARKQADREQRRVEAQLIDGGDDIHSPSGRTRKGLLDEWVEFAIKFWEIKPDVACTPQWLSETISMTKGVEAPSVGAIDAVLKRWQSYGYAVIEQKPNRFAGFTAEGKRLGLETLKEKHRIEARKYHMARGRGIR